MHASHQLSSLNNSYASNNSPPGFPAQLPFAQPLFSTHLPLSYAPSFGHRVQHGVSKVTSFRQVKGIQQVQNGQTSQPSGVGLAGQETILPDAFNARTLQDPASGNWNMDTGVSSQLNDNVNNLSDVFNSCIYSSVVVGDGRSIPVTNSGYSILPTPFRPLHLNNVLITPNIFKILIFVR